MPRIRLAVLAPLRSNLLATRIRGEKIKALIITGDDVDVHHWRETTAAVRKILLDSGRLRRDRQRRSQAAGIRRPAQAYDVIVLNRFNRKAKLSDEAKKNLLDFVRGGKGFYVQHLASASFANWPEFAKLCGRHWVMGSPGHGPRGEFDARSSSTNTRSPRG